MFLLLPLVAAVAFPVPAILFLSTTTGSLHIALDARQRHAWLGCVGGLPWTLLLALPVSYTAVLALFSVAQ